MVLRVFENLQVTLETGPQVYFSDYCLAKFSYIYWAPTVAGMSLLLCMPCV